jgi:hypothetical protein
VSCDAVRCEGKLYSRPIETLEGLQREGNLWCSYEMWHAIDPAIPGTVDELRKCTEIRKSQNRAQRSGSNSDLTWRSKVPCASLELVTLKNKIGLDGSGELSEDCRFVSSNGSCLFPLKLQVRAVCKRRGSKMYRCTCKQCV